MSITLKGQDQGIASLKASLPSLPTQTPLGAFLCRFPREIASSPRTAPVFPANMQSPEKHRGDLGSAFLQRSCLPGEPEDASAGPSCQGARLAASGKKAATVERPAGM
ncbi:hypothetical protein GGTG_03544 [Gaeumannomyces tritici R3-111a-1]|uniref:Uncharacterized protein n=1 Tax=Gaeumannomyces tritici (strain R3-111a-1) TaxID=644352 RepID=J3NQI8_GAET3|nr:hypothetical protein GGTG_03544 [Gaeumannomyces tritici R3-111a-1]EJT78444.1 hypothetical protein GGTG_03544 [Gaeumannomyces tritici R3-111a-1]